MAKNLKREKTKKEENAQKHNYNIEMGIGIVMIWMNGY